MKKKAKKSGRKGGSKGSCGKRKKLLVSREGKRRGRQKSPPPEMFTSDQGAVEETSDGGREKKEQSFRPLFPSSFSGEELFSPLSRGGGRLKRPLIFVGKESRPTSPYFATRHCLILSCLLSHLPG